MPATAERLEHGDLILNQGRIGGRHRGIERHERLLGREPVKVADGTGAELGGHDVESGVLCDDDAATLLQFLHDLTEALERHYAAELMLWNHQYRSSAAESPFTDPEDPPF